ncbi:MAG: NAD(P)(+) transhydrogenase (Re/Si-specific) subunit alpha, partial [Bacteroidota bacterium]
MMIGILKESEEEKRVAMLPDVVEMLTKMGIPVIVEADAGAGAFASDADYVSAGARIVTKPEACKAEMVLKINPPTEEEFRLIPEKTILFSQLNPLSNTNMVKKIADAGFTCFSLDVIPRTTRAQAMDILSSMATVNGYKAVLTAANSLPKFFPMFMTAAGTITPAKVLILGAGVAGLQSIATSRKLGAVVFVFDVRAAVKEEVIGLGAKFVDVEGAVDDKAAGGYAIEQTEEFKQ